MRILRERFKTGLNRIWTQMNADKAKDIIINDRSDRARPRHPH
jgi:hypothetical protein